MFLYLILIFFSDFLRLDVSLASSIFYTLYIYLFTVPFLFFIVLVFVCLFLCFFFIWCHSLYCCLLMPIFLLAFLIVVCWCPSSCCSLLVTFRYPSPDAVLPSAVVCHCCVLQLSCCLLPAFFLLSVCCFAFVVICICCFFWRCLLLQPVLLLKSAVALPQIVICCPSSCYSVFFLLSSIAARPSSVVCCYHAAYSCLLVLLCLDWDGVSDYFPQMISAYWLFCLDLSQCLFLTVLVLFMLPLCLFQPCFSWFCVVGCSCLIHINGSCVCPWLLLSFIILVSNSWLFLSHLYSSFVYPWLFLSHL